MLHKLQKDVYLGNADMTLTTGEPSVAPLLIILNKDLHYTELHILLTSKLKTKTQGKQEDLIRSEKNSFEKKTLLPINY